MTTCVSHEHDCNHFDRNFGSKLSIWKDNSPFSEYLQPRLFVIIWKHGFNLLAVRYKSVHHPVSYELIFLWFSFYEHNAKRSELYNFTVKRYIYICDSVISYLADSLRHRCLSVRSELRQREIRNFWLITWLVYFLASRYHTLMS